MNIVSLAVSLAGAALAGPRWATGPASIEGQAIAPAAITVTTVTVTTVIAPVGSTPTFSAGIEVSTSASQAIPNLFVNPSGGYVGIGTNAPDEQLTIYGGGPEIRMHDSDGPYLGRIYLNQNSLTLYATGEIFIDGPLTVNNMMTTAAEATLGAAVTATSSLNVTGADLSPDSIVFNVAGSTLTVLKTGRVGIGSASPGQLLTVAGTVESTSGGFKFPDSTTQTTAASTPVLISSAANVCPGTCNDFNPIDLDTCLSGSTVTITTGGSRRILMGFTGNIVNDSIGPLTMYGTFIVDGQTVGYPSYRWQIGQGVDLFVALTHLHPALPAGSHSICVAFYAGGALDIDGVNVKPRIWVSETLHSEAE